MFDHPELGTAKQRSLRAVNRHMALQEVEHWLKDLDDPIRLTADRGAWERGEPLLPTIDFSAVRGASGEANYLAGEIIYHLRTALEYVADNLAWLDSGQRQARTAFPIVDNSKDWERSCRTRLRGVSRAHCRVIREYQPFEGCSWTKKLRQLSNDDKHNFLLGAFTEHRFTVTVNEQTVTPDPDDSSKVIIKVEAPEAELRLTQGESVVPILADLSREVAQLIMRFQADFGENDELTINP